jgi:hypothetical protein
MYLKEKKSKKIGKFISWFPLQRDQLASVPHGCSRTAAALRGGEMARLLTKSESDETPYMVDTLCLKALPFRRRAEISAYHQAVVKSGRPVCASY